MIERKCDMFNLTDAYIAPFLERPKGTFNYLFSPKIVLSYWYIPTR